MGIQLQAGMDFRLPQYRKEVFLRFYEWQIRHRSHPGGVYYVLPYAAKYLGWDVEQCAWAAFLNGNTQNPVTTLMLMDAGNRPQLAGAVLRFYAENYADLEWDTDRRHHKSHLKRAIVSYVQALDGGSQLDYWKNATKQAQTPWQGCWAAAKALHGMGRLSAWSYLEYLVILGVLPGLDADDLMLGDMDGSRSHRNGLLLLNGKESQMAWRINPRPQPISKRELSELEWCANTMLMEVRGRLYDHPFAHHVTRLTLESALCTYKSWHLPRRRYPGVYNDLLYNRLRRAEARFGHRFDLLWEARFESLPQRLRLEDNPNDPGAVAAKQNWYLETGQVINLDTEWPYFRNGFTDNVANGVYGTRKN